MMNKDSKALKELWNLKKACFEEVKDLPVRKAIKKRLSDSLKHTKELGFKLSSTKTIAH